MCDSELTEEIKSRIKKEGEEDMNAEDRVEDVLEKSVAAAKLSCSATDNEDSNGDSKPYTDINSNGEEPVQCYQNKTAPFVQPPILAQTAIPPPHGAQFFMVAPNPQGSYPFQQVLIPINPPPSFTTNQMQVLPTQLQVPPTQLQVPPASLHAPLTSQSQYQQPQMNGAAVGQQFMTVPVSLNAMTGGQPIQFITNPAPLFTTGGLAGFTMMSPPTSSADNSQGKTSQVHGMPQMFPSMIIPATGATLVPMKPTDYQNTIDGSMVKPLPPGPITVTPLPNPGVSPQNGTSTVVKQLSEENTQVSSTNCPLSPGTTSETLVSHTEPGSVIDGIQLDDIKEFARQFKLRRLALGLTQSQVGLALSAAAGPAYSQSAICRFEKLDITAKSALKIKPILEKWLREAEANHKSGTQNIGVESPPPERNKKRKRRTSFTPQAIDILTEFFNKRSHPSGGEMSSLSTQLGYDREVIRVWFCNKRQALKNNEVKRIKPDL